MTDYRITTDPSTSPGHLQERAHPLRRDGLLCALGGLIAVLGVLGLALTDPAVPESRMSWPVPPATFRITEVVWTITHALTLFGALGLARSGFTGTGGWSRWGNRIAITGMALLVPAELALEFVASSPDDSTGAIVIGTLIGVAAVLAGVGLTIAGIRTLRAGRWAGPGRFTPLLSGLFVLLVLTPLGGASGYPFLAAIGGWNLCLTLLGVALAVSEPTGRGKLELEEWTLPG